MNAQCQWAYLVGKALLLQVEARRPELGALVEDRRPRPGCESALHCEGANVCENRTPLDAMDGRDGRDGDAWERCNEVCVQVGVRIS